MGEPTYDCTKCVGYCCCIYDRVDVNDKDIKRLARHFDVSVEKARKKFTKKMEGARVLRRQKDGIFKTRCTFLNPETRLCSIYEARPGTCRKWPTHGGDNCVYYDILQFERRQQDDPDYVPVVEIKVLVE